MRKAKSIFENSLIYFIGNILSKLIAFILLPLYTANIKPGDYGYYNLTNLYLSLLTSVACLEIWSTIMRFMFDFQTRDEKYKPVFNGLMIFFTSILIIIGAFFLANRLFHIEYAVLVLLYGLSICLSNLYGYIARGFGYNITFALSGLVSIGINVVINFVLILGFKWDYSALYIANIIALLCQCIFIEVKIRLGNNFKFGFLDIKLLKKMLVFTLPYSLNTATFWFLNSYSRTVIASKMGTEYNGYFSVASNFVLLITLIASCVNLAWQEEAFKTGSEIENVTNYYSTMTDKFLKYMCILAGMVLPAIYLIFPYVVNAQYNQALTIIPLFIFVTVESTYCSFLTAIYGAIKRTKVLFISSLLASMVNVILVHLLIGKFGMQAATISMALGFLVNVLIRVLVLKKYIDYQIDLKKIVILYLPLFCVSCFVFMYTDFVCNFVLLICYFLLSLVLFKELYNNIYGCLKREKN